MGYFALNEKEYDEVWNEFESRFKFIPNYYERLLPAITEPTPSLVYKLALSPTDEEIDELSSYFKALFCQAVESSQLMYALDWQHASYKFSPQQGYDNLPISIYPDGDYSIFLGPQMTFGTFGHPWQNILCIFGEELVGSVLKERPRMLEKIIRENT